jgi:hypothetical protein
MPVKKGVNNFATHQHDKVAFLKNKIDVHLERLRDAKGKFNNFNALATYLSALLTEDLLTRCTKQNKERERDIKPSLTKPKAVANSTLYRNLNYRAKLESFLAEAPLKGGTDLALVKTSLPMAEAKITELQIECSNLNSTIKTLERYIENSGIQVEKEASNQNILQQDTEQVNDFAQTARALALVLEEFEGMLSIKDDQLITLTRMTNQVVVNKVTFAPFLTWFGKLEVSFGG